MKELFRKSARAVADWAGTANAFLLAVLTVAIWAAVGPMFHYSENWQLVINTGTTIVTFLMVFLIQNAQNRDSQMVHLKLDELIRSNKNARNALMDLDRHSDAELVALHDDLCQQKDETTQKIEAVSKARIRRAR